MRLISRRYCQKKTSLFYSSRSMSSNYLLITLVTMRNSSSLGISRISLYRRLRSYRRRLCSWRKSIITFKWILLTYRFRVIILSLKLDKPKRCCRSKRKNKGKNYILCICKDIDLVCSLIKLYKHGLKPRLIRKCLRN